MGSSHFGVSDLAVTVLVGEIEELLHERVTTRYNTAQHENVRCIADTPAGRNNPMDSGTGTKGGL